MLVIIRFRSQDPDFPLRLQPAIDVLSGKPGFESSDLVRNIDEPDLWALVLRWTNVGSYRRALGGYESKAIVAPLLSEALDEPSAYEEPSAHEPIEAPIR